MSVPLIPAVVVLSIATTLILTVPVTTATPAQPGITAQAELATLELQRTAMTTTPAPMTHATQLRGCVPTRMTTQIHVQPTEIGVQQTSVRQAHVCIPQGATTAMSAQQTLVMHKHAVAVILTITIPVAITTPAPRQTPASQEPAQGQTQLSALH